MRSTRSDARGEFLIRGVNAGTYTLHASAPGYQAISERTVTIGAGNATLSVVLFPATTNSLTVIGEVRASAGETISTSSAPTISLNAQSAAAGGCDLGRGYGLAAAFGYTRHPARRGQQCHSDVCGARARPNGDAR